MESQKTEKSKDKLWIEKIGEGYLCIKNGILSFVGGAEFHTKEQNQVILTKDETRKVYDFLKEYYEE